LKNLTESQTAKEARDFHQRHDLGDIVDVEILVRAALVARDPDEEASDDIEGLTYLEKRALQSERPQNLLQQFNKLSKESWLVLTTCCVGAITQ
jgi:hypothetical protein